MPTRDEIAFFGAGPARIPTGIAEAGGRDFVNYLNSGVSLAEISHRSPTATKVLTDAKSALTKLLEVPDNYEILFFHGGGSGQFSAVAYNMVAVWVENRRIQAHKDFNGDSEKIWNRVRNEVLNHLQCDYLVTGSWSLKASQEAANLLEPVTPEGAKGHVNIVTDARGSNGGKFGVIPAEYRWSLTSPKANAGCGAAYVFYCDNETVDGVEFPGFPKSLETQAGDEERLVVADMSSNFLSRKIDVSKYAAIFAGAQKNVGITDTTLVIVRKDILTTQPPPSFLHSVGIWSAPSILSWPIIAKNDSLYNTMPIFSISIAGAVMQSLLDTHGASGLAGQEALSNAKAEMIYRILDQNPEVYQVVPSRAVRSRMNICLRVVDEATEKEFLEGAESRKLLGLKGHRSVGGIRVSNYNAITMANIRKLAEYFIDFARRKQ